MRRKIWMGRREGIDLASALPPLTQTRYRRALHPRAAGPHRRQDHPALHPRSDQHLRSLVSPLDDLAAGKRASEIWDCCGGKVSTSNQTIKRSRMKKIVNEIIKSELNEEVEAVSQIVDLGSVNNVYDVKCKGGAYILRINKDENKEFEFWKEKWCIEKVTILGVPSPKILKVGMKGKFPFMILSKIEGTNGSKCSTEQNLLIWERLGQFARKFHSINKIEELHITTDEFHTNWKSKLEYNIGELSEKDSLLKRNAFNISEQEKVKSILIKLKDKEFNEGLVHGDLCPRNVIYNNQLVYLLDWGTSGINIVPHTEIGIILIENKLEEKEFDSFLKGMGIQPVEYQKIEEETIQLNLLHRLDKYRWADGREFVEIDEYISKLRIAYEKLMN
ncbi:aminoglycoside phosphotransferase family protein [Neolewinella lacunae]|uniref:Aminoglycoside phosphotransferase family protein n=1 Tax=Neolewinella lacunae TaxID=1517758 RepID=A0A923PIY5_9BACT|nr:aminoglycoside phosphotransferase family protein [Neolewinella lacunae]MBC6994937.1 aminoglycoside phosphotransferase family protein [Neolewinella lacunae]MDN3636119.1 aminoglycoside phosphotransferase family protein [Neolewinella lacunae]